MKTVILENIRVANDVFLLKLKKPDGFAFKSGQFLMLKVNNLNEPLLRRPFSMIDLDNLIGVYYKIIGLGTKILQSLKVGESVDFNGPFGNNFEIKKDKSIVLCGGGIGVAPLVGLKHLLDTKDIKYDCYFGFNKKEDCFVNFGRIFTLDGSLGEKGTPLSAIELLDSNYHVYACGPMSMLKCISEIADKNGFSMDISLESNMACGFGVCLGCAVNTINGYTQVCKDGPIFNYSEIIW